MRERTITIAVILILLTAGIIYSIYESLVDLRRREADMHLRYQIMLLEKDAELLEAEGRLLEYMAEVEGER
jgi:hypothetical protein